MKAKSKPIILTLTGLMTLSFTIVRCSPIASSIPKTSSGPESSLLPTTQGGEFEGALQTLALQTQVDYTLSPPASKLTETDKVRKITLSGKNIDEFVKNRKVSIELPPDVQLDSGAVTLSLALSSASMPSGYEKDLVLQLVQDKASKWWLFLKSDRTKSETEKWIQAALNALTGIQLGFAEKSGQE